MPHRHYDLFITEPHHSVPVFCRVCGAPCRVRRDVLGPVGFASALAGQKVRHDEHVCLHTGEAWHERAVAMLRSIEAEPSERIAQVRRAELDDLIASEHR